MNLDEARAARREAEKKGPTITVEDVVFQLPVELPLSVTLWLNDLSEAQEADDNAAAVKAVGGVLRGLFGKDYNRFMEVSQIAMEDMEDLLNGIVKDYGFSDQGEAPASES
jgi:hypothetical protein